MADTRREQLAAAAAKNLQESKVVFENGYNRRMVKDSSGKWIYDPEESRVRREIIDRDMADEERGTPRQYVVDTAIGKLTVPTTGQNASKLDRMAADEAADRLNKMGIGTRGYNRETGSGPKPKKK